MSGFGITGKENTAYYRLMVLSKALKFEARTGMQMGRGPSAYSIVKKEFNLKGNKQKVSDQFEALLPSLKPEGFTVQKI